MSEYKQSEYKRKRLFVDGSIQVSLMLRATGYWIFCLTTMTVGLCVWQYFMTPDRSMHLRFNDMLFHYGPAVVVAVLLLPLVILDVLRVSNRFVGPFLRLRRVMRDVTRGADVEPIRFRKGDFWQEFADEFNDLVIRLKAAEQRLDEARTEHEAVEDVAYPSSS